MKLTNHVIDGCRTRPLVLDAAWSDNSAPKGIVIFCHGYKGYKDWGCWNLAGNEFVSADYLFIKFNFSYNGGTVDQPIDFPDLKTFSENNYSTELGDVNKVISWAKTGKELEQYHHLPIYLVGHSRGGSIALLAASQNKAVSALITWAAVADFAPRFPIGGALEEWEKSGVYFVRNGRTQQDMPHLYQWYVDFQQNLASLDIPSHAKSLSLPTLLIHGDEDEAVSVEDAFSLASWIRDSQLMIVEATGHTFGTSHPWSDSSLPPAFAGVIQQSLKFLMGLQTASRTS